jgi:hypothetical protein
MGDLSQAEMVYFTVMRIPTASLSTTILSSRWQNKWVHICLSSRPFSYMLLVHVYTKTALILHLPATLQTCKWPTFITVYIPDVDVEI